MTSNNNIMTSLVKRAGIVVLSAVLCIAALSGTAFAYFTANVSASGGHELTLGYESHLEEKLDGLNKDISMQNTGQTDIKVRVLIFYSDWMNESGDVTVNTANAEGSDKWFRVENYDGDGEMWEYSDVLQPGDRTTSLIAAVTANKEIKDFDIIIVGQTNPVYYDESNKAHGTIWD